MLEWIKKKAVAKSQRNIDIVLKSLISVCEELDKQIAEHGGRITSGPAYELLARIIHEDLGF